MMTRYSQSAAALLLTGCGCALALPAAAQQIPYDTGQYEYAEDPAGTRGDDVVTERVEAPAPRPAERVIPARRDGMAPVFVRSEIVQGAGALAPAPIAPVAVAPSAAVRMGTPVVAASPAPAVPLYRGTGPVYYALPGAYAVPTAAPGGASRVILRDGTVPTATLAPPPGYVAVPPGLPMGSQLVAFDRQAWLDSCRARLASYEPEDRAAALASLGYGALGHVAGQDECASYLDGYLAAATAGTLPATPAYGQAYMLVPVTVLVDAPRK